MSDGIREKAPPKTRPPCSEALDAEVTEADFDTGTIKIQFMAPIEFTSPRGSIQGGFVAAMIDEAIGVPVLIKSNGKLAPLTLDLNLTYIKPVMPGRVYGEGQIVKMGRSIAYTEAQLYDKDGDLLVKATATSKLTPIE